MAIQLNVNGEERMSIHDPMTPLVDVLRDEFHLTGAKTVCREGFCGACLVMVDGSPTLSCLLPAGLAEARDIRTVEAFSSGGTLSALQQAFLDHDAVQCGMCFPGMLMTLTEFLEREPEPTRESVKAVLAGNICRCTGYERIVDAALSAAQR
jgi:carbon-monoxide dehydrogenase small subunit